MLRTHTAGSLRTGDVGTDVVLTGWVDGRRDHGGVEFIDLRDASGIVQVVFRDEALASGVRSVRNEYCVKVSGTVTAREADNVNPDIPTGEVEVVVSDIEVLNAAAPLPFQLDERTAVGEETRLKYRYLDLRRGRMHEAIKLRSKVTSTIRRVLDENDFYDIETPTLTRSTPEGARDFLVPARLHPGSWYALPQSPQLFKQLLMVAGMERYYQIARCYRDEDFRADRQPEFTQLDLEMSFVDQEDIISISEEVMAAVWKLIDVELPRPMPRITWHDAMDKYGSDKPDLRFGNELVEMTEFFKDTPFRVFQNEYVGAVVMPGGASLPRRQFDAWQDWARQRGAKGLAYVTVAEDGTLGGPVAKNISDTEREGLAAKTGANPGDAIFFAAGERESSQELLGAARLEIAERTGMIPENSWAFCWVVDAPMFKPRDKAAADGDVALGAGQWNAVHHAFTSPKPEFLDTFDTDPGAALSYGYDFVCNGVEVGGGSIRIHQPDVQQRVFKVMGLSEEEAKEKFGFLLEAFSFGAPPHGGIAWGIDRLVMLLGGFDTIRDVIAFPKSGGGYDPLTDAPAPITLQQRREAGVDAKPKKKGEGDGTEGEAGKGGKPAAAKK